MAHPAWCLQAVLYHLVITLKVIVRTDVMKL